MQDLSVNELSLNKNDLNHPNPFVHHSPNTANVSWSSASSPIPTMTNLAMANQPCTETNIDCNSYNNPNNLTVDNRSDYYYLNNNDVISNESSYEYPTMENGSQFDAASSPEMDSKMNSSSETRKEANQTKDEKKKK